MSFIQVKIGEVILGKGTTSADFISLVYNHNSNESLLEQELKLRELFLHLIGLSATPSVWRSLNPSCYKKYKDLHLSFIVAILGSS